MEGARRSDRRLPVLGLADDLETLRLEDRPCRCSEARMVVCDYHGLGHCTHRVRGGGGVSTVVHTLLACNISARRPLKHRVDQRFALAGAKRLLRLDRQPELHPLLGVVRVPAGLLAQLLHAVPERVPVHPEPVGRLAPAATAVEQSRQRLEEPGVGGGRSEDAGDERLERSARQAQQQLERAEVVVGRDRAGDGVERRARLEQAAAESRPRRRPADSDADPRRRFDELARQRKCVVLLVGRDEERRSVSA